MAHTKPGLRGCGTRVEGGIYAECGHSPFGEPLEYFLIDPPMIIDPDELGLSAVGVKLVEGPDGITHVMDWVGKNHYPNVADFLEEVRVLGMSRRLPKSLDFSKLQHGSRVLLVHSKAHIENHADYWNDLREFDGATRFCPQKHDHHNIARVEEMCARLWWYDVIPDLSRAEREAMYAAGEREFERHFASAHYKAVMPPEGITGEYAPAIFASFPISNLSVIRAEDGSHEGAVDAVKHASVEFSLDDL